MDIHKLTIQGFKSFYEKSVFTFGKNITAIVGPNGSGKSNITEGIRFVLGEQSAKSMRGKDVSDLLFKGNSAKASKAKVELEFIKNKQQNILLGNSENIFIKNVLEKDLVTVSRTVFLDGKSVYEVNGVEVRLKDVQEFLLYVHLGNKSSWHISQGEADHVLQSNPMVRKTLIEDALGLKVYHARINESTKKMDKTKENIREATLQRKEILPEISVLERQVEKIKKGEEYRKELYEKGVVYFFQKRKNILSLKETLSNGKKLEDLILELENLDVKIGKMQAEINRDNGNDEELLQTEIQKEEKVLNILNQNLSEIQNKKRNFDNLLSYSSLESEKVTKELLSIEQEFSKISSSGNDLIFSEQDVNDTKENIEQRVQHILDKNNIDAHLLEKIKDEAKDIELSYKRLLTKGSVVSKDNVKQITYLQSIKSRLQEKLQTLKKEIEDYTQSVNELQPTISKEELKIKISSERLNDFKKQLLEFKFKKVDREREVQTNIFSRNELQLEISKKQEMNFKILDLEKEVEQEMLEVNNILLEKINIPNEIENVVSTGEELNILKRNIERLKIKLEESQVNNAEEIIKKYEDLSERNKFLIKEIYDLENSMLNLEKVISDLKNSLKEEFENGLEQINSIFDSYVKRLFGGGSAKVFMVEIENKKKAEDENMDTEDGEETKMGVEVEVEIPKKKIKGLHSLSGGERALISIALNFSIINQNPAPFMILDETDAALDEANSKRYGEMLELLKEKTKLIVVTHNRETMHFADQIYGVTLHKDGHSKILSVSFDDAVEFAK